MTFTQQLATHLQPAFLMIIEGIVMAAVPFILMNFNKWMKAKSHDASFHCAMDKISTHAEAAVLDTFQTYTKAVRKSGKWDAEAATAAKTQGMGKLQGLLGPGGVKELMGCLSQSEEGVKGLLESGLEAAVNKLKQSGQLGEPSATLPAAPTPEP